MQYTPYLAAQGVDTEILPLLGNVRLIEDAALRRDMGIRGRTRALEFYSLASQAPCLLALLRSLA